MILTSQRVQGPTGQLAVTTAGEGGLPVVLVHGAGGNRSQWAAQQAHLKQRSVSFDLRGMGESDADPSDDYSIDAMAEDLKAVVDALGLERFALVGHSFGASVVSAFAAKHPERLAGLVFVDGGGDSRKRSHDEHLQFQWGIQPENYARFVGEWFDYILQHARTPTREAVLRSLRATPREVFVAAVESMYVFDPYPTFERYPGPKLSLFADFLEQPQAPHKLFPGLPHQRFTNVSHWLMMDVPEEFNAALDAFLAKLPR